MQIVQRLHWRREYVFCVNVNCECIKYDDISAPGGSEIFIFLDYKIRFLTTPQLNRQRIIPRFYLDSSFY